MIENQALDVFDGLHRINSYLVDGFGHPLIEQVVEEIRAKYFDPDNGTIIGWQSEVFRKKWQNLNEDEYLKKVDKLCSYVQSLRDSLYTVRNLGTVNPSSDILKRFRDHELKFFREMLFSVSRNELVVLLE